MSRTSAQGKKTFTTEEVNRISRNYPVLGNTGSQKLNDRGILGLIEDRLVPQPVVDPGDANAIPVGDNKSVYCSMTSTGADTRTVAAPDFVGQRVYLIHGTDGGSVAVTFTGASLNEAGNSVVTFTDAGEDLLVEAFGDADGTFVWKIVKKGGVSLA